MKVFNNGLGFCSAQKPQKSKWKILAGEDFLVVGDTGLEQLFSGTRSTFEFRPQKLSKHWCQLSGVPKLRQGGTAEYSFYYVKIWKIWTSDYLWCTRSDSNGWPHRCQRCALTSWATGANGCTNFKGITSSSTLEALPCQGSALTNWAMGT